MQALISQQEVDRLTDLLVDALSRLGHEHRRRDGTAQRVSVKRRLLTEGGSILLLEVDTQRLPHGVRADELTACRALHHLTAVLHRPVKVLNTTGITYAVLLGATGTGKARLPEKADLAAVLPGHPGGAHAFPLGEGPAGPVWGDLSGHYLVGGETGSGKTTFLLSTLLSLTLTAAPEDLQVVLVDPKAVDFVALAGSAHLALPIASEVTETEEALSWLVAQVEERRRLFLGQLARDLEAYNTKAEQKLPYLLAVIDEVTDLALQAGLRSSFYKNLIRLSSIGRSFGLRLILATQNPKAEVLNTLIRGNLSARVAFRVTTPEHSRVVLGVPGAEKLPRVPGRMLARLGDGRLHELQGYRVGDEVLAALARVGDPLGALAGEERKLLRYALDRLGGRFPEAEICRGCGITQSRYRQVRDRLERAGILTRGEKNALMVSQDAVF